MSRSSKALRTEWLRRVLVEAPIIVGSILLAFAIDASWGARAERVERRQALEGLREEFLEHQAYYPQVITRLEGRMEDIQTLMTGEEAMSEGFDALDTSVFQLLIVTTIDPGRGLRDALVSSGRLEVIHDLNLRKRVARWESVVDEVRDNQALMRALVADQLVPYMAAEGFPLAQTLSTNGPSHHLWPPALQWPSGPSRHMGDIATYRRVLSDAEFQSYVSVRYLWLAWTVTELREAVAEIDQVLSGLAQELEDR